VGTFAFTDASKKMSPSTVNRVRLVLASIFLSISCLFSDHLSLVELITETSPNAYLWFGLSGIIGLSLGDYFAFTAYQLIGGAKTALMSCIAPAAALIFAYFLLDETLSGIGIMGIFISMSGILLLIYSNQGKQLATSQTQGSVSKGFLFAFLGAICQGIGLVLAKNGFHTETNSMSAIHATWIRMFIATIVLYVFTGFNKQSIIEFKQVLGSKKLLKPILIGSVFGPVIGVSLSLLATQYLTAGITQTLLSLLPASVTLASVFVLKEKFSKSIFISLFISLLGVIVLIWRAQIADFIF
jgi:drug/metabolite transporter (DMT)-like permease